MLATLVVQLLPSLIQAASPLILGLVNHANANQTPVPIKTSPAAETESFAQHLIYMLPELIKAGFDIKDLVEHSAGLVKTMLAENRGPTATEREDQMARIDAADAEFDKAAKP